MSEPSSREHDLFTAALELPATARADYLARVCRGDAALRARVESLVRAHTAAGDFLSVPPALIAAEPPPAAGVGQKIGRYRLLEKLGEGGCGTVYLAAQEEPVRRQVALKLIKPGMDTQQVIARFQAERQVLALMDHPNIAKVFDAGTSENHRPYFVMELVSGEPITTFCDRHGLDPPARLALFAQVCRAVHHAHQKGVIHRDLKPSNILVTLPDGPAAAPVPKVIDFGVAKTATCLPGDPGVQTLVEQLVGTPVYMSPEQAGRGGPELDPRSDVYSLGALLYELLTGRPPFDPATIVRAGLDEVRRIIREVEPPKPSTRVHTLTDADRAVVANLRRTAPTQLAPTLRGDLDAIVMKALHKDRAHRYETARALAEDLECSVRREPITARAPGRGQALGRFVRRHRINLAVGAAVVVALSLAALVSTALVLRAAIVALTLAAGTSTVLAVRATRARRRTEQVTRVFRNLLDALGPTSTLSPVSGLDRDGTRWREILEQASAQTARELQAQPAVEAEVCHMFGKVHLAIGQRAQAAAMLRRSLALRRRLPDADALEIARTLYDLGLVLFMEDDATEGEALLREALAIRRARLGGDHPEVVHTLEDLGFCVWARGDHLPAELLLREAVELRRQTRTLEKFDNPNVPPLWALTVCLSFLGRFEEAEPLARENLAAVLARFDHHHRFVRHSYEVLADCLTRRGDVVAALPCWREALTLYRITQPADHPTLAYSTWGVAHCLHQLGDLDGAEPLYRETLSLWRRRHPAGHREIIQRLDGLAGLLVQRSQFPEAQALLDEAWSKLADPAHAEWLAFHGEVIQGQIDLHTAWARIEPTRAAEIARWKLRQQEFEDATLQRPPGRDRVNALRGLAQMYRCRAWSDATLAERATFWDQRLRECWERDGPGKAASG